MRSELLIALIAALCAWFAPTAGALTRAQATPAPHYDEAVAVLVVVLGDGITLDTFEGDQDEPLSLHKYIYVKNNPVNLVDPSGHDGLAIDVLFAGNWSMSMRSSWEANRVKIYGSAIAAAAGVATYYGGSWAVGEGGQTLAARSAIKAAGKTLEGLIEDAKQILGQARNSPIKVIPMPRCIIPAVANHVAEAQSRGLPGLSVPLTRCPPSQAKANRAAALAGVGFAFPDSWDEYPFASSWQGGGASSLQKVPLWQNLVQGGIISMCYKIEKIEYFPATPYFVVVTP